MLSDRPTVLYFEDLKFLKIIKTLLMDCFFDLAVFAQSRYETIVSE
jgi:hypothetical protein